MLNIPYVDDSVVYNPHDGTVLSHGTELPVTKELIERAKDQLETGEILDRWIAKSNEDSLKIRALGAILDNNLLIYDLFSNRDRARFASELYDMSQDDIHFEEKNRDYFNNFSNYVVSNLKDVRTYFDEEMDISFSNMADDFINFNYSIFEDLENDGNLRPKR